MGWLYTLPGFWLLYGGMSIPLFVWLAIETCYDGLVLTWFMCSFAVAIAMFWQQCPRRWWRNTRFCAGLTLLGIAYACGLMTKFNTLMAFGVPFLIIFFRRGALAVIREAPAPITAALIAVIIVGPFYHHHFYEAEGAWMPISMNWDRRRTWPKRVTCATRTGCIPSYT